MLVDQSTDEMFVPLNNMFEQQKAFLEVIDRVETCDWVSRKILGRGANLKVVCLAFRSR